MKNVKYFAVLLLVSAVPTSAFGMFARHIARSVVGASAGRIRTSYSSSKPAQKIFDTIDTNSDKANDYEEYFSTLTDIEQDIIAEDMYPRSIALMRIYTKRRKKETDQDRIDYIDAQIARLKRNHWWS